MRAIPNCITIGRIILSLFLIFIKPLSMPFYAVYIICGLSDIVDGVIARKTGTTSRLGAKLDSVADMTMAGILFVVLYPAINPPTQIIIWFVSIGIVRLTSMAAAFSKFGTFAVLHTCGNKITGMLLFIFPLLLPFLDTTILMYIICGVASISAIEELIIHMTSSELQLDRKSIFVKFTNQL